MIRHITAAAAATIALSSAAGAEGDAAAGEKVFNQCRACHMVGDNAQSRVGPALNGVVGSAAGAVEGFRYSDALMAKAAEGLTWDAETLAAYLADPRGFIPNNRMAFAGLRKDEDIANVIAYLSQY